MCKTGIELINIRLYLYYKQANSIDEWNINVSGHKHICINLQLCIFVIKYSYYSLNY